MIDLEESIKLLRLRLEIERTIKLLRKNRDLGTAKILVQIGKPAVKPLIKALRGEYKFEDIQEKLLFEVAEKECKSLGWALIEKREIEFRGYVAWALGEIRGVEAVEVLIEAFTDKYGEVQTKAVKALVKIGKASVEPLIDALSDESGEGLQMHSEH